MASSSSVESVTVNKGDQVSVTVEESSANIISVKFTSGGKCYRGILLQDDTSQYGINPERVHGAPFWPPLSSSGINLKTTPCSTERYSYKFEGQPSALTVFQPEVIKRSNRNQPAPQLSRILRPRRFVCRKCKKAYHVEEENGIEMSSAALSLQIERSNQESVVASSDNETALVPSPNSSISKVLRGSRSKLTLIDDANQLQSIRRVTPSIIPKLNDDYGLSGRESEADSNSDDAVVVRRKKVGIVERPVTNEEPAVTPVKTVIPAKRKAEFAGKPNRSKKVKRTTSELSNSDGVSVANKNCPDRFCTSMEPIASTGVTTYPDDQRVPLAPANNPLNTESMSQLSAQATDCPQTLTNIEDAVVRKNRIKAQYVSVATPFRFPPSRSSKPNLFANNPLGIGSREKTTAPKRTRNVDPSPKKTKSDNDVHSPNSPRKSNCSTVHDLSGQKKPSVSDITPTRSRTRARSNLSSTSSSTLDPLAAAPKGAPGSMICQIARSPEGVPVSVIDINSGSGFIEPTTTVAECDPDGDLTSTISSSQTKINSPASIGQQANSALSTQPSAIADGANNRSRSMDYEKPKNRWIREARARRSQEERGAGLSVINPGAATVAIPASSNTEVLGSSSTGVSSPTVSRLRVRSGEGGLTNVSPVASVSPKAASSAKKRSNNSTVTIPESGTITSEEEISKSSASVSACSPREALPVVDTSNAALPVLKIKINRQRKPSSSSPNNAQYELVELQVPEVDDLHATKSHMHDSVGSAASTEISADNVESKSGALCNGSLPLPGGGVSPTLSSSSSRKGLVPTETPELGRLVKQCQLSDGVVFRVGDLVWSKLSGWPYWPAQITSIHQSVNDDQEIDGELGSEQQGKKPVSYTACLHWFAWHQVSYMTCDKLYHFMQHYKRFDSKKRRGVFRQAVNEARQAADKIQNAPSSPSDSEFGENEEVVYPSNPSTDVLPSTSMLNPELDCNGAPQDCISVTSANTISAVVLPNEAVESEEVALSSAIVDVNQIAASSVPVSSSPSKRTPTSGSARRGMSRGRSRSLRGRRGGKAGPSTRVQSGVRNLPSFLSPSESDVKTPYDQFDEMDSVQIPLPFRRQAPWATRGRGARNKETGLVFNPAVNVSNTTASEVTSSSLPVSTGSLKIKLSTVHFRLPSSKKRQSAKSKTTKKRTKPIPKSENSVPFTDPVSDTPVSAAGPTPSASSNVSSNPNQPSTGCSDLLTHFQSNYDDPSEAILSQFPDVFQDPRPGVLSDAVEIPTFSEDESEEENAGRLIIDPEVMAAVNVSNAIHAPAPQNSVPRGKSENATPQGALYGTPSYFSTTPASINAMRTNLDPLFAHGASSLMNPHRSQPAEVAFASKASLQSSVPPPTNPVLLYHPAGFSSHATNTTTTSTVLPFPIKEDDELPCVSRSRTLDLFDPTLNPRSSYFRPSSHIGVAPVTTPSAVPYVTSDYPTR